VAALGCDLNRWMQHLDSNYRAEGVENEAETEKQPFAYPQKCPAQGRAFLSKRSLRLRYGYRRANGYAMPFSFLILSTNDDRTSLTSRIPILLNSVIGSGTALMGSVMRSVPARPAIA
jgi:hypothetical protein